MRINRFLIAAAAAIGLSACLPALAGAQDFQTDRVITAEEIEPAVKVMNDWNAKLYPAFKLKYSSNPNASQAQGLIAMRDGNRVIAILAAKYLSTGAQSLTAPMGQYAPPAVTTKVFDQLRAASYPESGQWNEFSMGNLNDTPGRVLVGLVEGGAQLPGTTACPTGEYARGRTDAKADMRRALDAIP